MASKRTSKRTKRTIKKCPVKKAVKKVEEPYNGPKILIFDIESAPAITYLWSLRQKYIPIDMLKEDIFIMCWAAKWLHKSDIITQSLPDHKTAYKKNKKDDSLIMKPLWALMDEADMVVAHNAKNFDVPMAYARFLLHGMDPPNPFKIIDTLQIARREFRIISNKLDYIGEYLDLGKKNKTDFDLWLRCMNGEQDAWNEMLAYNIQDTLLLEKVYLKLRAWDKRHPNVGLYVDSNHPVCTACGSENLIQKGYEYTQVGMYKRWKCKTCGHPNRGRYTQLPKDKRKTLITNAV